MIKVNQLGVKAGSFSRDGITFEVSKGEYVALMGRTGSGKTTLLETLCGLRTATSGTVMIGNIDCTNAHPSTRGIGYVPQDGALFPTMTVEEQLTFPLKLRRRSAVDCKRLVAVMADRLGLKLLLNRYPQGLSGGEVQRVALGRALIFEPSIILLDEPFSALDTPTREGLYSLMESLREERSLSALHVTHNANEAERLGDRILRPV